MDFTIPKLHNKVSSTIPSSGVFWLATTFVLFFSNAFSDLVSVMMGFHCAFLEALLLFSPMQCYSCV